MKKLTNFEKYIKELRDRYEDRKYNFVLDISEEKFKESLLRLFAKHPKAALEMYFKSHGICGYEKVFIKNLAAEYKLPIKNINNKLRIIHSEINHRKSGFIFRSFNCDEKEKLSNKWEPYVGKYAILKGKSSIFDSNFSEIICVKYNHVFLRSGYDGFSTISICEFDELYKPFVSKNK